MEEPDYDDMIEDYMEEEAYAHHSTAPATGAAEDFYDDNFLEEMAAEQHERSATRASTTTAARDEEEDAVPTTMLAPASPSSSSETSPAAHVRQAFASRNRHDGGSGADPFAFERYEEGVSWRTEKTSSPMTMRARAWKAALQQKQRDANSDDSDEDDNIFTPKTRRGRPKTTTKRLATTPDAQLLQFQEARYHFAVHQNHGSRRNHSVRKIRVLDCQYSSSNRNHHGMTFKPTEGYRHVPMTLAHGSRVYVRVVASPEKHEKAKTCDTDTNFSLGISMTELKRRVDAMRRKQEHQRLRLVSLQARSSRRHAEQLNNDEMSDDNDDNDSPTEEPPVLVDDQLWVDKHAPSSFANLLSEERTNREVIRALREWDPYVFRRAPPPRPNFGAKNDADNNNKVDLDGKKHHKNPKDTRPEEQKRVILLSGPPGVGKTTLAHIAAHHSGYRPIEVNGSDERSAAVLTERVLRAMESSTLQLQPKDSSSKNSSWDLLGGRPNCLILDEIDGADAKGAIQSLVELIRQDMHTGAGGKNKPYLRRPIIFICNNKYAPALRPLLPYARQFNVAPPTPSRLVARLRAVLSTEGMSVFGGTTLLHQLVAKTGGDIRSCLYTLQFAAASVKEEHQEKQASHPNSSMLMDVTKSLLTSLKGGDAMKDDRTDVAGTTLTVFRKAKKRGTRDRLVGNKLDDTRTSVERVLDSIECFGDDSRILDCLYLNLLNVSYIDPTFDRCASAMEWLSSADLHRTSASTQQQVSCAAAAVHLLCRVEQTPELTFTTRELSDVHFQQEANVGLAHKFVEGLSAKVKSSRCTGVVATETIPYVLWILSAGEGSSALTRPASSFDILNKLEKLSFRLHAETLRSLGLTYKAIADDEGGSALRNPYGGHSQTTRMELEPPIDRFVQFQQLQNRRKAIPGAMKELLARCATLEGIRESGAVAGKLDGDAHSSNNSKEPAKPPAVAELHQSAELPLNDLENSKRSAKAVEPSGQERPTKRTKAAPNFLCLGAKQAREAKSARRAKTVGFVRTKTAKKSNTGSGVSFQQVLRLRYVKGFTQAVRNPCRLEDLA